jgi:hypothetical protein
MIHVIMIIIYRLIVLFVLGCTVRHALDKENDGYGQLTEVLLVIPLLLRVLMIK